MTREEAIKWLIKPVRTSTDIGEIKAKELEAYDMAIEALLAESVNGWRTGKPTKNGRYAVTLNLWGHRHINIMYYGEPQMPSREVDGACWYMCDDEWGDVVYDDKDIIAWMPLPEPYKGGDSE